MIIIFTSSFIVLGQNEEPYKTEIKIVSYNIHSGTDKDMIPTLFDIIDFLKKSDADIICLQEVNESSKVGFQVSSLKEELNMYSHFGANVANVNTNYGLVTYSKYEIIYKKHVYLSSKKEQRGFLDTIVNINGKLVHIINIHLGLDDVERKKQVGEVKKYIEDNKAKTFIIVGDFNDGEVTLSDNNIRDAAEELQQSNVLTFSIGLDRIDYIFISKDIEVKSYEVLIKNMSDHYPLIAKFLI